jgi:hypothetical protein
MCPVRRRSTFHRSVQNRERLAISFEITDATLGLSFDVSCDFFFFGHQDMSHRYRTLVLYPLEQR